MAALRCGLGLKILNEQVDVRCFSITVYQRSLLKADLFLLRQVQHVKGGGEGFLVPCFPSGVWGAEQVENLLSSPKMGMEHLNVKPRTCPKGYPAI